MPGEDRVVVLVAVAEGGSVPLPKPTRRSSGPMTPAPGPPPRPPPAVRLTRPHCHEGPGSRRRDLAGSQMVISGARPLRRDVGSAGHNVFCFEPSDAMPQAVLTYHY